MASLSSANANLTHRVRSIHVACSFLCNICGKVYKRQKNFEKHRCTISQSSVKNERKGGKDLIKIKKVLKRSDKSPRKNHGPLKHLEKRNSKIVMPKLKHRTPKSNLKVLTETSPNVTSVTAVLGELNANNFKDKLSINDMIEMQPYNIVSCRKLQTKYGERVKLELEDQQMFLPERYTTILTNDAMDFINAGGCCISRENRGQYYNLKFTKVCTD